MQEARLRPLTDREQRVAEFLRRGAAVETVFLLVAAAQGVLARGFVQAYCRSAPAGPQVGTAGDRYCHTVGHAYTWIVFAVAGAGVAQLTLLAAHRLRKRRAIGLGAVFALVIANTVVVSSLANVGP